MSERLHRIVEDTHFWSQRNARSTCFVERKGAVTLLTRAIQIECFWRIRAFRSTKIVLPSPASSQALQIQCFQRLRSISFDKNSTSGAECSQTLQIECFWRQALTGTTNKLPSDTPEGPFGTNQIGPKLLPRSRVRPGPRNPDLRGR